LGDFLSLLMHIILHGEGFFMSNSTKIKEIKVKTGTIETEQREMVFTKPVELPANERQWYICFLQGDRLIRNFAIVGVLMLTVLALKSHPAPQAQSVFSALKEGAGMEWDESVGKLSFVNSFLPESIRAVWNENNDVTVYAPVHGKAVHTWSVYEPYVELKSVTKNVFAAADGVVMSIAHGVDEERILRIRHEDGMETLYGNLDVCYVEEGEQVRAGDLIADLMTDGNLVFELRIDGRSVDPQGKMVAAE